MAARSPKVDFGIDAPGLLKTFLTIGVIGAAIAVALVTLAETHLWLVVLSSVIAVIATYCLGMACLMVYGSRVYKIHECERLLDRIGFGGNESLLDVGCGGGMMMILASKRLTTGRAVGIDLWQASDQSRNSPATTLANAAAAGVQDKVTVQTGDMRQLPFEAASFDVVVTHWVLHNLPTAPDREQAIAEMKRVVRPGGRLLIMDIIGQHDYLKMLTSLDVKNVEMIGPGLREKLFGLVSFGSFKPAGLLATI